MNPRKDQVKDKTNTLPKDLAGYQMLAKGTIETGDIIADSTFSYPRYSIMVTPFSVWNGLDVAEQAKVGNNVYRIMPCPKQSDSHQRDSAIETRSHEMHIADPNGKKDSVLKAKTYDDGKPPLAHLPWDALREVALVQAYGHSKYKDYSNYRKGMEGSRNISCAMRHLASYMEGQTLDTESHRSHLAHAACRILFVLQNEADGTLIDDRYVKPAK